MYRVLCSMKPEIPDVKSYQTESNQNEKLLLLLSRFSHHFYPLRQSDYKTLHCMSCNFFVTLTFPKRVNILS